MENRRERFSNRNYWRNCCCCNYCSITCISNWYFSDAAPLPTDNDIVTPTIEPENEVAVQSEDKLLVYTTFYPLYQFTQGVAGDTADVRILMPNNGDPHAFELGPKTIAELTKADVLVYNGIDFEPYIDEVMSSPDFEHIVFVDTSEGIELLEGEAHDHHGHGHGGHSEDKHDDHENMMITMIMMNILKTFTKKLHML